MLYCPACQRVQPNHFHYPSPVTPPVIHFLHPAVLPSTTWILTKYKLEREKHPDMAELKQPCIIINTAAQHPLHGHHSNQWSADVWLIYQLTPCAMTYKTHYVEFSVPAHKLTIAHVCVLGGVMGLLINADDSVITGWNADIRALSGLSVQPIIICGEPIIPPPKHTHTYIHKTHTFF